MFVAFVAALAPATARAQSQEERAAARAVLAEADKQVAAGDYAGAVDSFTKAYAIVPAPTIKVGRAHAYLSLGRLLEAQQDLLDAARSQPHPGEPAPFGEARRRATAEADAITPRLPFLSLAVTGAPAEKIALTIDGAAVAATPLGAPRAVNPGTHSVRAEADGYLPIEQVVTVLEGEHKTLTFPLSAAQPAVPGSPAPEGAPPPPAPAGSSPAGLALPSAPEPTRSNALSTAALIGGGVFAGTGIVTGLVAIVQAGNVKSQCKQNVCPTSTQAEANTSSALGNVSTVTFAAAGACLLVGILTHHGAPSRAATGPSFDVTVGPGTIGAFGRF
jgi:hypothetical protein